jgi:peptidoglycan lytic transglycosylase
VPSPTAPAPFPPGVQPVEPGTYVERGIASWYGPPFDGRRASDGEIFDMRQMVAAHRTLPFGSIVRVTNLDNGLQAEVRIIDRGPFVEGRIIDLSLAAARAIDMVRSGIAPVRLELVASPAPLNGVFAVQIGAFEKHANADRLRARLAARYPVTLQEFDAPAGHFYRVRVGREPSQEAAEKLAEQLAREDGFQTFVVRLDDTQ